jgi:glycosyltransferase involved in cell wall biosynthesis
LILVTTWPGQPSVEQLEREAREGLRPRTDYVELARRLDADIVDANYLSNRSSKLTRFVARVGGLAQGQVLEALLRERQYRWVLGWADHLGFRLAAASKLVRRRMKLVVVSGRLATQKKRLLLGPLAVHTHIDAIVNYSSVQRDTGITFGVPPAKLNLLLQPVDERFWQSATECSGETICAVGYEARDYDTLLASVRGLPVQLEIAVGSSVLAGARGRARWVGAAASDRVKIHHQLSYVALRDLYARARIVVIPLKDVSQDAGVTAITEALAMTKPVVVTQTRGQVDIVRDGEHGMLVAPSDSGAMRAALERLLGDPTFSQRMGEAGRRLVCEQHSLDRYVSDLARLVTRIVSAGQ